MLSILFYFIPILLVLEFNPLDFDNFESNFSLYNSYVFYFFVIFYLNFIIKKEVNTKLDLDLTLKYLILIFKTPNFLLNYLINIFKKIFLFLIHIKYKHLYNTLNIFLKKYFLNFFVLWRPLFKKTSYFGYFRSNRSKWIK